MLYKFENDELFMHSARLSKRDTAALKVIGKWLGARKKPSRVIDAIGFALRTVQQAIDENTTPSAKQAQPKKTQPITPEAVKRCKKPRLAPAQKQRLREAYAAGMTLTAVAHKYGVAVSTVHRVVTRNAAAQ